MPLHHHRLRALPSAALCLPALLALLSLTGCGGEPSSGDIEKAVKSQVDKDNQQYKQFAGSASGGDMPKFFGSKKLGCVNDKGGAGYTCDVEVDVSGPFGGARSKGVVPIRFVKGSDGWVITK